MKISKEELDDLYINQKMSSREIAKKLEISHRTVLDRMEKFGIKRRTRNEVKKLSIDKKMLEDLYVNQRLSLREVAKKLGVSTRTILRRMKEFDIEIRTISESQKGKHLSEEHRKKIGKSQKGKHLSKETKEKLSRVRWKYGDRIANAISDAKRRDLGFNPLNKPFPNSHGHHLQDMETVIFIPEKLHRRIKHSYKTGKNMNIIDALALYYLELEILGEVM